MFGVGTDIVNSALHLWVAVWSAALLVFVCALAFYWSRARTAARVSIVFAAAMFGAALTWAFLDAASLRDSNADRRALEARAATLNAESFAPGSPLACLNGLAGDAVEAACEKALFAAPATVASATSYVAARLSLLSDMVAYMKRDGGNIDSALLPLRRSLEADRFGFVAHTLFVADGCTAGRCQAFGLLRDSNQVRANLSRQAFEHYLNRYQTAWSQAPDVPLADAGLPAQPAASAPHKIVDIDFPSAASIPPISIMNPEPKGPPGAAAVAAATAGEPNAHENAAPPRRGRKPAANTVTQTPPPAAPAASRVDPVWLPGTEPIPLVGAPLPAGSNAASAAPVQLGPFQTAQPNTGPAHAQ